MNFGAERELFEMEYGEIRDQAAKAVTEFLEVARLKAGDLLVIGCSSSEIVGEKIGKGSDFNAAEAVFDGVYPILRERGIFLAAQCCEHLNRSLILERCCAERHGWEEVNVVPQPKAGGSFATKAYRSFEDPVAVEHIRANAGMDIGGTLMGMHLKEVAVPVRLSMSHIGQAVLLCARTRPRFVGGSRAVYDETKM